MSSVTIPRQMIAVSRFASGPVEIVSGPTLLMDRVDESQPRENLSFPGRQAWRLRVEAWVDTRTKTLPDGREVEMPVLDTQTVTVWSASRPDVVPGQYVKLVDLMAGAVDGNVYFYALGVEDSAGVAA